MARYKSISDINKQSRRIQDEVNRRLRSLKTNAWGVYQNEKDKQEAQRLNARSVRAGDAAIRYKENMFAKGYSDSNMSERSKKAPQSVYMGIVAG